MDRRVLRPVPQRLLTHVFSVNDLQVQSLQMKENRIQTPGIQDENTTWWRSFDSQINDYDNYFAELLHDQSIADLIESNADPVRALDLMSSHAFISSLVPVAEERQGFDYGISVGLTDRSTVERSDNPTTYHLTRDVRDKNLWRLLTLYSRNKGRPNLVTLHADFGFMSMHSRYYYEEDAFFLQTFPKIYNICAAHANMLIQVPDNFELSLDNIVNYLVHIGIDAIYGETQYLSSALFVRKRPHTRRLLEEEHMYRIAGIHIEALKTTH